MASAKSSVVMSGHKSLTALMMASNASGVLPPPSRRSRRVTMASTSRSLCFSDTADGVELVGFAELLGLGSCSIGHVG